MAATQDDEVTRVICLAQASPHPFIQRALQTEAALRKAQTKDFLKLWQVVQTDLKTCPDLKTRLLKRIDNDVSYLWELKRQFKLIVPDKDAPVSPYWATQKNRMISILRGARDIVDKHEQDILSGCIPPGYGLEQEEVTRLGTNPNTVFGSPKHPYFSCLLFLLRREIELKSFPAAEWVDQTSLAYLLPLPPTEPPLLNPLCSFAFPKELLCFHGGYLAGGQSNERYGPQGKTCGPEDCSSGLGKIMGSPNRFYTHDLRKCDLILRGKQDFPDAKVWIQSPIGTYLLKTLEPVDVQDPQRDIRPGDLYYNRIFSDLDFGMKGVGDKGHMALVLSVLSSGDIVTLGYSSSFDSRVNVDGFGIGIFPYSSTFPKKVGILRAKSRQEP